ncbi:MAG: GGDEF domain-containing protein [Candidatus Omnitrophica bacterium]|nr:GGDEF domain-containing protein [Candidatus Omnitrophota bacterium]
MFHIALFFLLSILWYMFLRDFFSERIRSLENQNTQKLDELAILTNLKENLISENTQLDKKLADTLALYELTKDICKSLEEEKVFSIFNKNLKKYIEIGDCRYIKEAADLIKYKDYTILPLNIEENQIIGYLAVDRILESDKEKFGILAQQLLIGLRRALLYEKVQSMIITDSLTGVYCRRYFLERFSEELRRSKRNKLHLTFLMIDIDNFKQFNDRYGHLVGDAILRKVSKIINDAVRQIDFIGRYGGEEISIVLTETDRDQANFAAERIRQAIAGALIKIYDEELKVTVSIGVSTFPDNALNMQDLIDMADQALYLAKETGKNKVCFSPA